MINNNYAIIMAGGIGSRFWPMSTSKIPKQFLDVLGNGETLLQQAFRRLSKICPPSQILIVTNTDYKDICKKQLPNIKEQNILCEPARRNTAPCIAYASFKIQHENRDANIIVAPSDHLVTNEDEFERIVKECLEVSAQKDYLITLGIKPSRPETGYGYIQFSEKCCKENETLRKVKTFTEKPNLEIAQQFLDSGDFLWNSGMFIWSVSSIVLSIEKLLPEMYEVFLEGKELYNTDDEIDFINRVFPTCKNISIDYGIMEKSKNVFVYPSDFGWSDLGTWGSLENHIEADEFNNTLISKQVLLYDSENNIVKLPKEKVAVIQGMDGYIIVDTKEALLICKKEEEQKIKQFVADIKNSISRK
ncbi:MAG: NTP transferase domain-containing protein [Flavobacteriales bacterium]|nr:NTP transferase domain-containing protein [Flavobacteriales bacterium]